MNPMLSLLLTLHLESSLIRSYSSETRRICFPSPSEIHLIGIVESKTHSSQPGCMWVACMPEQMPELRQKHALSSFLSFSSDQPGPFAVPCWHNEYEDAKNTNGACCTAHASDICFSMAADAADVQTTWFVVSIKCAAVSFERVFNQWTSTWTTHIYDS